MSNRKRNMLEAFQASAQEAQGEHVPHTTGGTGGPFAEEAHKPAPVAPRAPGPSFDPVDGEVPSLAQALARLPLGPIAGAQLLLLALVFWLGYLSAGARTVEASDGLDNSSYSSPPADRGNSTRAARTKPAPNTTETEDPAMTPYDKAFFASWENGLTLRVTSYDRNPQNAELAWSTYDFLRESGLPVILPVEKTKSIFIFVGTAQKASELGELKQRLAKLEWPKGEFPFGDAFVTNIKDYYKPR